MNTELIYQSFKQCPNIIVGDGSYAMPTSSWLFGKFKSWYFTMLGALKSSGYSAQWDCDDFASIFRVMAQICHAQTRTRPEEGIAVGELFYMMDSGGGHAICCAFTENGLIFIEPQTGEQLKLSATELQSVSFVRF